MTLNQSIPWNVPFEHKWVWRSLGYSDQSFWTRTQTSSHTNYSWIPCLCYIPLKTPSVAFSYLQVTKLLNNMLDYLIKIHLELLLDWRNSLSISFAESSAEQFYGPWWSLPWRPGSFLHSNEAIMAQLIISETALQLWQQQEKNFKVERAVITSSAGIS